MLPGLPTFIYATSVTSVCPSLPPALPSLSALQLHPAWITATLFSLASPINPSISSNWFRTLPPVSSPGLHQSHHTCSPATPLPSILVRTFKAIHNLPPGLTGLPHPLVSLCFQPICPPCAPEPSVTLAPISGILTLLTSLSFFKSRLKPQLFKQAHALWLSLFCCKF